MAVAKIYNSQTGQWEAVIVGTTGDTGVVQSDTEPSNTDQLWLDTDDTAEPLAIPAGGSAGQILQKSTDGDYDTAWRNVPSHNYIINGAFDIWQRGETFTDTSSSTSLIGPDRWSIRDGQTGRTLSKQSTNDTTNLPDIQNCIRWQRDSGSTNAVIAYLNQGLETANSIPLAGKSVSLSFWARAGADWSQSDDILGVQLRSGTGTDERPWNGYTGQVLVINTGVLLTTTWQRFTLTGTVDSTAKELATWFYWTPTGTAGANDYVEITGVQLEAGSVATPFKRNANSIQGELAACRRYARRYEAQGNVFARFGLGLVDGANDVQVPFLEWSEMRTLPTSITISGASDFLVETAGGGYAVNSVSLSNGNSLRFDTASAPLYGVALVRGNNAASAFILVSSEL